jgi:hypothetical protein
MKRNLYSQFNFGGFTINDELYMKNLKKRVKIAQENYNKTELSKYVDFYTYASTWSKIQQEFFNYFVTLEPKYKKILINALDNHIKSAKSMGSYLYPSYDDSVKLLIQLKK